MPGVKLSISVKDKHLNHFEKVLKDAEKAGLDCARRPAITLDRLDY